jgi:uncharacterized glyoxalase superfamily protein PhnB
MKTSLTGLTLHVEHVERSRDFYPRLQVLAAGLEPDGPPANRSWGERTFHLSDPDGNRIEFDSQID